MVYLLLILFGTYLGYLMDHLVEDISVGYWEGYGDKRSSLKENAKLAAENWYSDIMYLFRYFINKVLRIV